MDRYVEAAVIDMQAAREELLAAVSHVDEGGWGRYVPYGARTLHDLLAHVAAADHTWALAAQGLLKAEGQETPALTPEAAIALRERAIARGRRRPVGALLEEMAQRRRLLLSLYELLERRHLALALRSFGDEHNSVRERLWLGYHDRMHAADVRRALRMRWHPQRLDYVPEVRAAAAALSPDATLYVIYSVDPVQWERPSALPGWTSRQLLAHIATGDWVCQRILRNVVDDGEIPPWPDVNAGNEQRVTEERRLVTVSALAEEYLSMRHESLRLVSQLRPEHLSLTMEFWWEPRPNRHTLLDYVLRFHVHDRTHREQLRPAMRYACVGGPKDAAVQT